MTLQETPYTTIDRIDREVTRAEEAAEASLADRIDRAVARAEQVARRSEQAAVRAERAAQEAARSSPSPNAPFRYNTREVDYAFACLGEAGSPLDRFLLLVLARDASANGYAIADRTALAVDMPETDWNDILNGLRRLEGLGLLRAVDRRHTSYQERQTFRLLTTSERRGD